MSFDAESKQPVFVMIPEMFQKGWELRVDGKKQRLFPAWYLFLGFELKDGAHHVDLRFRPPGLYLGIFLNILALGYLVFVVGKDRGRAPG